MIDQQRAHERVLYEHFINLLESREGTSQQLLFPQTINFNAADAGLINELLEDIKALGFDISPFGKDTFVVNGIPAGISENESKEILEGVLENYKNNLSEIKLDSRENLARAMAKKLGIKKGKHLAGEEMNNLIDQLFACNMPYSSPSGKPTLITLTLDDLEKKFQR